MEKLILFWDEGRQLGRVKKVNAKQIFALIWTIIAILVSLIVVLGMSYPPFFIISWQTMVGLFFAIFLVATLPIYLLIILWHIVSEKIEEE